MTWLFWMPGEAGRTYGSATELREGAGGYQAVKVRQRAWCYT